MRKLELNLSNKYFIWVMAWVLIHRVTIAQESYNFEFTDNSSLESAIEKIESSTSLKFYYEEEWIEGVTVSGQYNGTIKDITQKLFSESKLQFVLLQDKVIITNNTPIISSFIPASAENDLQYLFSREYNGTSQSDTRILGEKADMVIGGESTVAGFIRNMDTAEPIVGAVVYTETPERNAVTNARGFYTIQLPNGSNELKVRFAGMKLTKQDIVLFSDGELNLDMEQEAILLEDITVTADQDENIATTKMGVNSLEMEELKNVPKVLGENDVVQVALTLPGVQNVGEGSAGINVRGGKTDQNLMLFNNATVYNPFHFFGFFSAFNADVMGESELYKSSIPANYGGRLSSLLDVKLKVADKEEFHGKGGISPVTSQLSLEVPLIKGKTSLITGVRTTYSDWILNRVNNENIRNSDPSFLDIATGINHEYGENSSITTSFYYSRDQFRITTDSLYTYFNLNGAFEWKHFFSPQLMAKLIASRSEYSFDIDYEQIPEFAFAYGFDIAENFGQLSFSYFPTDRHEIQFGADSKLYDLTPGFMRPVGEASEVIPESIEDEKGRESSFFISDNFNVTSDLTLYAGLRYSIFTALGSRNINQYQEGLPRNEVNLIGTEVFSDNESIRTFAGPELRLSARYGLNTTTSLKFAYNRTRQYIHALSNNISISPTDTWKLSDPNIAPQLSQQFSAGYFRNFKSNSIETSVEVYYKTFENLLDYKVGADLVLNPLIETDVLQGDGRAYGIEFLARKKVGKLNGWVSYTYSRTFQRFNSEFPEEQINDGDFFPSNFDKPHDISIVSNYKHTRRYSLSMNILYSTGRPITYPTAKYNLSGTEIVHFSDRNSFRIPDYFRVDLSVNVEGSHRIKKLGHSYWSFSLYNLLGRRNVYSIFFSNNDGEIQAFELSVLGNVIPSISYNFKF